MTKKTDAWFPLYIGDWDAATRHLDVAEDGAYFRLIRCYWTNGPLPDDDGKLARIVGVTVPRWHKLRAAVSGFFVIGDGLWRHKRADLELERAAEKHARAVERASAGGRAKAARERASSVLEAENKHAPSPSQVLARASYKALAENLRRAPTSEPEGSSPPAWTGPADIRALVVAKMGEPYAKSWLDPCGWQDVPERMIQTPGSLAADRLWRDFRREFQEREISIGRKAA